MTRIFDKNSKNISVTLVKVDSNTIIDNFENNKKNQIQIGTGSNKHLSKSVKNHIEKAKLNDIYKIISFNINESDKENFKIGEKIDISSFKIGDKIDICGLSKGKGFAGVMKRHGFSGMPASHGHEKQRIPGSIGCRFPQRVVKGKRMAGHMGFTNITMKNLEIVDLDENNNLIAVKGSIPGRYKTLLTISKKWKI